MPPISKLRTRKLGNWINSIIEGEEKPPADYINFTEQGGLHGTCITCPENVAPRSLEIQSVSIRDKTMHSAKITMCDDCFNAYEEAMIKNEEEIDLRIRRWVRRNHFPTDATEYTYINAKEEDVVKCVFCRTKQIHTNTSDIYIPQGITNRIEGPCKVCSDCRRSIREERRSLLTVLNKPITSSCKKCLQTYNISLGEKKRRERVGELHNYVCDKCIINEKNYYNCKRVFEAACKGCKRPFPIDLSYYPTFVGNLPRKCKRCTSTVKSNDVFTFETSSGILIHGYRNTVNNSWYYVLEQVKDYGRNEIIFDSQNWKEPFTDIFNLMIDAVKETETLTGYFKNQLL